MKEFRISKIVFDYTEDGRRSIAMHKIELKLDGVHVGHLVWEETTGEIYKLWVHEDHRRKGFATEMWNQASWMNPAPKHSEWRTDEGEAWALSIGGELPPRLRA